jgi:PKD repeat protein
MRGVGMDMRFNKVLSSIAISSMLVLTAMVVVLPTTVQAAWFDSSTMAFEPKELFQGETYSAKYTLNFGEEDGVTQVTVTQALVQYGWESTPSTIFSGSVNIASFPNEHVFTHDVEVPAEQAGGSYTVNVTVVAYINGDIGTISESTHTFNSEVVIASETLSAVATADSTTGLAPAEIGFDVTASGGSEKYSYSWNFGDGSAAVTEKNPTHEYAVGGTYTANVTVTDDLGRTTYAKTAAITIAPGIVVNITAQPSSGPYPLDVTFHSTVTNAAAGELTYEWDFGDGETSDQASPTHTYAEAGNYTATLKVTDSSDRTGTSSGLAVRVSSSVSPETSISASTDHGLGPLIVDFTSTVDGGTYPYEYLWSFGDGDTSTEANPSHTYDDPGIYLVHLTVTDLASRQAVSDELTITVVSDTDMEVIIGATDMSGTVPLTVNFNSTILNGTGPYFYRWSFGDGVNSNQANPVHVYDEADTYKVTLTVTDSDSNVMISNQLTIVVSEPTATTIPAWVWIWSATGIIIVAVGVIAFVMMRRKK